MKPERLFSAHSYGGLRKPLLEASTPPPGCYTRDDFFRREIKRIFERNWLFVGRAEQLPRRGDFFCYDGPGGSAIVLHGADGRLKAFANSCRHRGSRLLDGNGSCKRIVCPYHAWCYDLGGALVGAPGMTETRHFERADFGLRELPLSGWAGFLFVTFEDDAAPLEDHLGNLVGKFAAHRCEDMRLVGELEFEIASNWKLLAENALEAYHTGTVHRDSLGQQASRPIDCRGGWTGLLVEDEASVATLPGEDKPFPHIEGLDDEAAGGAFFTLVYPNTQFVFAQDCMWWLAFTPLAVDRTRLAIGACFPRSTIALDGFAQRVEPYFRRWREATAEDNAICELQHRGQAAATRPGRYAASEFAVHAFANWVVDQVVH